MTDTDITAVIERVKKALAARTKTTVLFLTEYLAVLKLADEHKAQADRIAGYAEECHAVEQALGKALRYPWFEDDKANFPDATEADGVCVGEHVPGTIAEEAAARIAALEGALAKCVTARDVLELQIARGHARALLTTEPNNAD